jgi:hypothetical protein
MLAPAQADETAMISVLRDAGAAVREPAACSREPG